MIDMPIIYLASAILTVVLMLIAGAVRLVDASRANRKRRTGTRRSGHSMEDTIDGGYVFGDSGSSSSSCSSDD